VIVVTSPSFSVSIGSDMMLYLQLNLNPAPTKDAMFLLSPRKQASGPPNEPYLLGSFHSDQPRAFHRALGVVVEQFPCDVSRRI
jgi:hypothetical protein